jgi:peroxiredoxin
VVLNFWQSYCEPCTHEAPVMSQVSKQWANKGVVFVGVDVQDLSGPATAFMDRFDITYPSIPNNGSLLGHYGVTGYPETFFINKRGIVVPMPEAKGADGLPQVGHIVGPATPKLLDLGIETAMHDAATQNTRA